MRFFFVADNGLCYQHVTRKMVPRGPKRTILWSEMAKVETPPATQTPTLTSPNPDPNPNPSPNPSPNPNPNPNPTPTPPPTKVEALEDDSIFIETSTGKKYYLKIKGAKRPGVEAWNWATHLCQFSQLLGDETSP